MKEFQLKHKIRRRMYSIPVLILLVLAIIVIGRGAIGVLEKERTSRQHVRELEEKALALTLRSQELQDGIADLETEEGVMKELKEKFNLVEEGERVVVVVDPLSSTTEAEEPPDSWIEGLLGRVKRLFRLD